MARRLSIQDACSASAIDKNYIFEEQRLTKRVFDDGIVHIDFFAWGCRVRTNLLQLKGLFNHTTVGEGRPDAGAEHSIFAAIEPKKSNRLSDDVDAPVVSIQQQSLSSLAYYSLAGQRKDFPVVLF
ncbi:hypothetical protein Tco_1533808 [Tanacetum coccineum]